MKKNKYKYIIINTDNDDIFLFKNLRNIQSFIKNETDSKLSPAKISRKFKVKNSFIHLNYIIKLLIW